MSFTQYKPAFQLRASFVYFANTSFSVKLQPAGLQLEWQMYLAEIFPKLLKQLPCEPHSKKPLKWIPFLIKLQEQTLDLQPYWHEAFTKEVFLPIHQMFQRYFKDINLHNLTLQIFPKVFFIRQVVLGTYSEKNLWWSLLVVELQSCTQ